MSWHPIHKFGENGDIDPSPSSEEDIWTGGGNANANGTYDFPTEVEALEMSSTDGSDDQLIAHQGLDANFDIKDVEAALNGQNAVAIPSTWWRYNRGFNKDTSTPDNPFAGTVYVYRAGTPVVGGVPQTPGNIRAIIEAEYQQTMMCIYTVPRNHSLEIDQYRASISRLTAAGAAEIRLRVREFGGTFRVWDEISLHTQGKTGDVHEYASPLIIPAKADVKVSAIVTSANSHVDAGIDGRLFGMSVLGTW